MRFGRLLAALAGGILALASHDAAAKELQVVGQQMQQDYEPAPAIWLLSDEDTQIYLFGTIHVLPRGFRWRNPQLDAIVDQVDGLVVESTDDDSSPDMAALSGKMRTLTESRVPTSQQLAPSVRGKWRKLVEMAGMPFDYTDRMPLMPVLLGMGFNGVEDTGSSYEYGVETVLEAEFRESGRPVGSIESFAQVMYSLYRVDDRLVMRDLEEMLRAWSGKPVDPVYDDESGDASNVYAMEHAWARGEVQEEMDLGFGQGKLGRTFNRLLLANRNAKWAQWLDNRLDQPGSILVAVGAGHFEGEDSVLAQLREHGLEARRIN